MKFSLITKTLNIKYEKLEISLFRAVPFSLCLLSMSAHKNSSLLIFQFGKIIWGGHM